MANWFGDVLKSAASSLVGGLPGAALGLGTSVIGSLVSNGMNRSNQALTQEWQEKMNLQQQEWQEGMWNKTNEYNNASNQMQRLMDAGVNPNAAAAQIAGTNSAAQMAQQPAIPSGNPIPGVNMDLGSSVLDGMRVNKEMSLLDAQREDIQAGIDLKRAQEGYTKEQQAGQKVINGQMAFDLWLNYWFSPQERATALDEMESNIDKTLEDTRGIKIDNDVKQINRDVMIPLMIKEKTETIKLITANINKAVAEKVLAYEQVKESKKRQDLLDAQEVGQEEQNAILGFDKEIKSIIKSQYEAYGVPLNELQLNSIAKLYIEEARRGADGVGLTVDALIAAYEDNVDQVINDVYINNPQGSPGAAFQRTVGKTSMDRRSSARQNKKNNRSNSRSNNRSRSNSSNYEYRGSSGDWNPY